MNTVSTVVVRGRMLLLVAVVTLSTAIAQPRVSIAVASPTTGVLFVDDSVSRSGDGSTWAAAYRFLQDALAFATQPGNGITEIRIGQGVYKPDQGAGITPGNQNATFNVPSGVSLRGGYAGFGAKDPDARDFTQFESIVSGDLLGNDILAPLPQNWQNYNENSQHVVTVTNGTGSNILEGLVFTAGKVDYNTENFGGGLYVSGGKVKVIACVFRYCAAYQGGGLGFKNCSATINDCIFHDNYAYHGGGGYLKNSTATVGNCSFKKNRCVPAASSAAGGLALLSSTVEIFDCLFSENIAQQASPGGAIGGSFGTVAIDRCLFEGNAADFGGAVSSSGDFVLRDCEFVDNAANWAGSIWGTVKCYDCSFTSSYGHFDSGSVRSSSTSLFVRCLFTDSFVSWDGGGAVQGGGTFTSCMFKNNQSYYAGGGAMRITEPAMLVNCVFDGNWTYGLGGAVRVNAGVSSQIINCTFANNASATGAGALACEGVADVTNSILWNNAGTEPISGEPAIQFSCIQGGWPGDGNIGADPMFVNMTNGDDLRLAPTSPCIDAGNNLRLPADVADLDADGDTQEPLPLDLDQLPRCRNDPATADTGVPLGTAIVDLGAYEFQPKPAAGDATGDGFVNIDDLLAVIHQWGECAEGTDCPADIEPAGGDGAVNVQDLIGVLQNWR